MKTLDGTLYRRALDCSGPQSAHIRNTTSPHWRGWLKPENRCLVPANSFAEYAPEPNPETKKKDVVWFALNDVRPLFAFGGIWTEFRGDRGTKSKPIPRPSLGLRLPDDVAECDSRADPSQGDAGDPNDGRRARRLDARVMGRSQGAATTVAGCRPDDSCAGCRQGGPRGSGMIRWLINVRYAVHYGLNSDIARGPKSANGLNHLRGRALRPATQPAG